MSDQLTHLHQVLLLIADTVRALCVRHKLTYAIEGGTLLGAVRYGGFIPWDDDFDIVMPREDYERFLSVAEAELGPQFYLQTKFSEEHYAFEFAKIQLKNTHLYEPFAANAQVQQGIFIDVFPFDTLPKRGFRRQVFLAANHVLKNMLWVKCGYGTPEQRETWSAKLMGWLAKPFSIAKLKSWRRWLLGLPDRRNPEAFISDYPSAKVQTRWFADRQLFPFENTAFFGFTGYDRYLKSLYGDYNIEPAVEARQVHTTAKIEFGDY